MINNKMIYTTNNKIFYKRRLLLIVDPQIDFISGSLSTKNGKTAMDRLTKSIENGLLEKYSMVVITGDSHPSTHCSFIENGGQFPKHCTMGSKGMEIYPPLLEAIETSDFDGYHFLVKGDSQNKEEFSIFQNESNGKFLSDIIEREKFDTIDVCGIATDYCVYETIRDLMKIYPSQQIRVVTNCIAAVDETDTKLFDLMEDNGIEEIRF